MLGLGWPQWLTIIALVGGLLLTFKIMARAAIAYERKRQQREGQEPPPDQDAFEGERR